jgi:hypothetical protein
LKDEEVLALNVKLRGFKEQLEIIEVELIEKERVGLVKSKDDLIKKEELTALNERMRELKEQVIVIVNKKIDDDLPFL